MGVGGSRMGDGRTVFERFNVKTKGNGNPKDMLGKKILEHHQYEEWNQNSKWCMCNRDEIRNT